MSSPDYLVCLECEAPCYTFEWTDGETSEALCETCGNEEADQFLTPEEFDDLGRAGFDT